MDTMGTVLTLFHVTLFNVTVSTGIDWFPVSLYPSVLALYIKSCFVVPVYLQPQSYVLPVVITV